MNCSKNGWRVRFTAFAVGFMLACGPVAAQFGLSGTAPAAVVVSDSTSKAKADSAAAVLGQYKVVKKDLVPEAQVRIGTTIMVLIIVVMSFMNNFNPE